MSSKKLLIKQTDDHYKGLPNEITFIPGKGIAVHGGGNKKNIASFNALDVLGYNYIRNPEFFYREKGHTFSFIASEAGEPMVSDFLCEGYKLGCRGIDTQVSIDNPSSLIPSKGITFSLTEKLGNSKDYICLFQQNMLEIRAFAGKKVTLSFDAMASSPVNISTSLIFSFHSETPDKQRHGGVLSIGTKNNRFSVEFDMPELDEGTVFGNYAMTRVWLWLAAGSNYRNRAGEIGTNSREITINNIQLEIGKSKGFTPLNRELENLKVGAFYEKITLDWFLPNLGSTDGETDSVIATIPFKYRKWATPRADKITLQVSNMTDESIYRRDRDGIVVMGTATSTIAARVTEITIDREV